MSLGSFVVRPAAAGDRTFVVDSWVSSFRPRGSERTERHGALPADLGPLPRKLFGDTYRAAAELLLDDPETRTVVACSEGDPNLIWGFAAARAGALLYVFVKSGFRWHPPRGGQHVGSALLVAAGLKPGEPYAFAFRTHAWTRLVKVSRSWARGHYRPQSAQFGTREAPQP